MKTIYNIQGDLFSDAGVLIFNDIVSNKEVNLDLFNIEFANDMVYKYQQQSIITYLTGLTAQQQKAHTITITKKKIEMFNNINSILVDSLKNFNSDKIITAIGMLSELTKNKTSLTKLAKIKSWLKENY